MRKSHRWWLFLIYTTRRYRVSLREFGAFDILRLLDNTYTIRQIANNGNPSPTAKRHRWKIQRKADCFQAIVRGCLSATRVYIISNSRVKRVPQHPENKRKPGVTNKCPTEGSHSVAWAKGICEDFSRVLSSLVLSVAQKVHIARLQKE